MMMEVCWFPSRFALSLSLTHTQKIFIFGNHMFSCINKKNWMLLTENKRGLRLFIFYFDSFMFKTG